MAAAPGSSLCTGCALCCQGWIFFETKLTPDEADSLRPLIPVLTRPHGEAMCQPCAFSADTLCNRYETRPATCRSYSCASLTAFERGDLAFDEARDRLDRARTAMNELGHALRAAGWMEPGEAGVTAWRNFARAAREASDPVAFRKQFSAVLLAGAVAAAAGELAVGECL